MKRRTFALLLALTGFSFGSVQADHDQLVYIGTYTGGQSPSKGIYAYGLDSETGKLTELGLAAETVRPSFLAIHPTKKYLYAVSEGSGKEGGLSSFSIDLKTGKLTFLNKQSSQGSGPCHVSVDKTGKVLMAANYGSGHVSSLPILADGSLGDQGTAILQGPPSLANESRQKGPHAHSINPSPDNRFALACDLGCDRVFVYDLDTEKGTLAAHDPASATVPPGGGPRHLAFHPNGKYVYVNNELTMTVSAFSYDAEKGSLALLDTLSTLPPGTENNKFSTAEVQVHPSGKFVYVSNRTHDSIAIYGVDEATGKLTWVETTPSVVAVPRNFGIDPTGKWLIAAGQNSNNLAVFSIDQASGKITPTGQQLEVGAPVCVKFITLE